MKILYITTIGCTMVFFKDFISKLIEEGHTVDIACNDRESKVDEFYNEIGCKIYTIDSSRSPINKGNIRAIKQIKKIVKENEYDIVHCHTPIASACTRIACKSFRKKGSKVIYTAHGFHFFKGCPFKNKLIFYPLEKICSHFTDILITINKEDFELAKKKLKAKKIAYVPGVGIDVEMFKYALADKPLMCEEIGIPQDAKILLSVGETNANKNHSTVIKALPLVDDKSLHYVIAGDGLLKEQLSEIAVKYGVGDRVHPLGKRSDVALLYNLADLYIHPSFREGLPVAVMEAMAGGLPIACSKIRGNVDLIDEAGGVLFSPYSVEECAGAINSLLESNTEALGNYNMQKAEQFSVNKINEEMLSLYNS